MYIPQPTLADVRNIEWGKSYLWDMLFAHKDSFYWDAIGNWYLDTSESPPPPPLHFQGWFPAYNVIEPVYTVTGQNVPTPLINFDVPKTLNTAKLTVDFYDDVYSSLRIWLNTWALYMFNVSYTPLDTSGYNYTSIFESGARPLDQCVCALYLRKYTPSHERTLIKKYLVYPSDTLSNSMNSETGADMFSATFSIISGMYSRPQP